MISDWNAIEAYDSRSFFCSSFLEPLRSRVFKNLGRSGLILQAACLMDLMMSADIVAKKFRLSTEGPFFPCRSFLFDPFALRALGRHYCQMVTNLGSSLYLGSFRQSKTLKDADPLALAARGRGGR
jgi:hypothetical protein